MSRDDRIVLGAAAIAAALIPRQTRLAAGVAGAIVLSRAHGAARQAGFQKAYRDFETYVELVIARHRGGLIDRVDDLDDLMINQYRNAAPATAYGVRALDRIRERAHDRISEHYAKVQHDIDAEFGPQERAS